MSNDRLIISYRGENILIFGNGYLYDGMAWPKLRGLHNYIDAKLDGGEANIIVENDYFPDENNIDL